MADRKRLAGAAPVWVGDLECVCVRVRESVCMAVCIYT